jgi:modulator of FtsH protease HflK
MSYKNVTPPEIDLSKLPLHWLKYAVFALIPLIALFTSFYQVPAESVGVVLRFGKAQADVKSPGLHFKLPLGIDNVIILPTERQLKLEFGFSASEASNPDQSSSYSENQSERNMVTGDLNAALVDWVVQYRIEDPKDYLFLVKEPGATLRDISESVMREVIGDRTIDEVLTIGRQDIEISAREKLAAVAKSYQLGIIVDQVQLKDVDPPVPVQNSFDEVNKAQQDKENVVNVANGEYNRIVPKTRGEADQRISAAEGYRLKRVNEAEGDVASFEAQLKEYVKAPEIMKARLYFENISEVLSQSGPKTIIDPEIKGLLPVMPAHSGAPTQTLSVPTTNPTRQRP